MRLSRAQRAGLAPAAMLGAASGYAIVGVISMPVAATLVILGCAAFGAATWWLSLTDLRERRLPNPVVLAATIVLTVPLSAASVMRGTSVMLAQTWGIVLLLGALLLLVWWCVPRVMGAGDVKLAPAVVFLPAWVLPEAGLVIFPLVLCAATVIVGATALWRRTSHIAYGPVLLGASWAAAFAGVLIAH